MKKRLKEIMLSPAGPVILSVVIWAAILLGIAITADASGPGYQYIEQTESQAVIALTEQVAEQYPICPELLQAIIFYESCNRMGVSNGSCIGYMQVSTRYHSGRADKLGVSLWDGYGNILTGTDYLMELIEEHGDVAAALMVYHGEQGAVDRAERGEISGYARKILELSALLERNHGK